VIEFVVELVAELLFYALGELIVAGLRQVGGWLAERTGLGHGPGGRASRAPRGPLPMPVACAGLLIAGAALGGVSFWVWPHRLVEPGPLPGISVIVSPIVNGLLTDAVGSFRANHGKRRTALGTFWGGACFALGMAAVRFALLQRLR
jgi:hypothetical protein